MDNFSDLQKKILLATLVVVLLFVVKLTYDNKYSSKTLSDESNQKAVESLEEINSDEPDEDDKTDTIFVQVCGRVKNPGLIELNQGSRVIDAVNAAGGMYEDADLDNINLAKKLEDEERVHVPAVSETSTSDLPSSDQGKVNINTASAEELKSLPGIGPKMAEKIIKYRDKNSFSKIEDIMNVGGIGEKKFEEIKDYIKTN
ncbi:helix-hairpin-helix domain-containing protein [Peptoniphilus catoniae]|uniref:helix-hairpin-helix domain-containing protein n=1 Tax=Peptoniphilus catoniae TaxID=1660341 RepID=UPI0010FCE88B|nr:helix-hairpin-helix domain-containing protein [Peptoniphilus catoniae]